MDAGRHRHRQLDRGLAGSRRAGRGSWRRRCPRAVAVVRPATAAGVHRRGRQAPDAVAAASAPKLPSQPRPIADVEAGQRDIFHARHAAAAPGAATRAARATAAPTAAAIAAGDELARAFRLDGDAGRPAPQVWWAMGVNEEVTVKPGTTLDDGYVVQSIDDHVVVLVYPSLGATARLPLPQSQPANP